MYDERFSLKPLHLPGIYELIIFFSSLLSSMSPVNALFVPQPFLFICILILGCNSFCNSFLVSRFPLIPRSATAKSPSRAPFKGSPSLLQAYEINNKIIDEINDDDDDDIQFPQPLTPVDRALRASRFWSSAVPGKR